MGFEYTVAIIQQHTNQINAVGGTIAYLGDDIQAAIGVDIYQFKIKVVFRAGRSSGRFKLAIPIAPEKIDYPI